MAIGLSRGNPGAPPEWPISSTNMVPSDSDRLKWYSIFSKSIQKRTTAPFAPQPATQPPATLDTLQEASKQGSKETNTRRAKNTDARSSKQLRRTVKQTTPTAVAGLLQARGAIGQQRGISVPSLCKRCASAMQAMCKRGRFVCKLGLEHM